MKSGTLTCGFKYEFDEAVMDNMELMEALYDVQNGDPSGVSRVVGLVLGKEQKTALYNHIRTEDGRVPTQAVFEAFKELMSTEKK